MNHLETFTDEELRTLFREALSEEDRITPLKGFKLDFSANPGFRKVFFSAKCSCGTAALLSVEVSGDKTPTQVRKALPALVGRLKSQARLFYNMPCETHTRMRTQLGPKQSP